jgi:hypothetical protein
MPTSQLEMQNKMELERANMEGKLIPKGVSTKVSGFATGFTNFAHKQQEKAELRAKQLEARAMAVSVSSIVIPIPLLSPFTCSSSLDAE